MNKNRKQAMLSENDYITALSVLKKKIEEMETHEGQYIKKDDVLTLLRVFCPMIKER